MRPFPAVSRMIGDNLRREISWLKQLMDSAPTSASGHRSSGVDTASAVGHADAYTQSRVRHETKASFSEAGGDWRAVPEWASFLIRFGYAWRVTSRARRIALLTLPCDSAAAGLISLGALVRDLCDPAANDESNHFLALSRFTRQYVDSCRTCNIRCDPSEKGCGYSERASGIVRDRDGRRYRVTDSIDHATYGSSILCVREEVTTYLLSSYAKHWTIDGQPRINTDTRGASLDAAPYQHIIDGAKPLLKNLSRSFSGLCLAGRSRGESSSRDMMGSIRFNCGGLEHGLADLLTIDDWSSCNPVSRVSFYNSRTRRMDRFGCSPSLVVADGDSGFLRALDERRFDNSDVIGVVERTLEHDRLESVGNKMTTLRRWYEVDTESARLGGPAPYGITVTILVRRST
jgi:hypothetical protein